MNVSNLYIFSPSQNPSGFQLLTAKTLGVAASSLTTDSFIARKNLLITWYSAGKDVAGKNYMQINGDSGNNYSYRYGDGDTASSVLNTSAFLVDYFNQTFAAYGIVNLRNDATINKMGTYSSMSAGAALTQGGFVWANATDAISTITLTTTTAAKLSAGSYIEVFGAD